MATKPATKTKPRPKSIAEQIAEVEARDAKAAEQAEIAAKASSVFKSLPHDKLEALPPEIRDIAAKIEHDERTQEIQGRVEYDAAAESALLADELYLSWKHAERRMAESQFTTPADQRNVENAKRAYERQAQHTTALRSGNKKNRAFSVLPYDDLLKAFARSPASDFEIDDEAAFLGELVPAKGQSWDDVIANMTAEWRAFDPKIQQVERLPSTHHEAARKMRPFVARLVDDEVAGAVHDTFFPGAPIELKKESLLGFLRMEIWKGVDVALHDQAKKFGKRMISADEREKRIAKLKREKAEAEALLCAWVRAGIAAGAKVYFPAGVDPFTALGIRPRAKQPKRPVQPIIDVA